MPKLYCYIDESGVGARLFAVGAVIVGDDRDDLANTCKRIERDTGKGIAKWRRAKHKVGTLVTSFVDMRGVPRDESNALIRLADCIAGFVRDVQEEQSQDAVALFERAQRQGVIVQV